MSKYCDDVKLNYLEATTPVCTGQSRDQYRKIILTSRKKIKITRLLYDFSKHEIITIPVENTPLNTEYSGNYVNRSNKISSGICSHIVYMIEFHHVSVQSYMQCDRQLHNYCY